MRVARISTQGIQPAFRVALPRPEKPAVGDLYRYIAEIKLPQIVDPNVSPAKHIPLPDVEFQKEQFIKHFINDLKQAMSWFEQFATPELVKANLGKFIKPSSPAFVDSEFFLSSLTKQ